MSEREMVRGRRKGVSEGEMVRGMVERKEVNGTKQ